MKKGSKIQLTFVLAIVTALMVVIAGCGSKSASQSSPSSSPSNQAQNTPSSAPADESAPQEMTTIRVGYMPGPTSSSAVAIAQKLGYFEENGIKIAGTKFLTGPEEFQAMQAGDLDIINIGPGATHLAAKGQGTVIMVDTLGMGDFVLTYKGSGVESIQDLKGKTVGIPKGSSAEMILNLALAREGMSQKDLKDGTAANIAASGIVSAAVTEQVAAVGIWTVLAEEIKKQIGEENYVVLAESRDFYPEYVFPGSWVVHPKFLENNPEAVASFLKALVKANEFRAHNKEESVEMTSEFDGSDVAAGLVNYDNAKWLNNEELKEAYTSGMVSQWYEGLQEMFVEIGIMNEVVPVDQFVNTEIILGAFE